MPLLNDLHELDLSVEQTKAFDLLTEPEHADINRVVYGGQAGGGKSVLISLWLDHMAMTYPGTRYYMAREVLKDLKESILTTYFDVMAELGRKYIYQEHKNRIKYPETNSYIYLLEVSFAPSDPDFQGLGSKEFTAGAIEEGVSVTKRAADILLTRTRYKHDIYNLTPKQLITCNPGPGWIKDDVVIPQQETGRALRATDIFIPATLASNPNKQFAEQYKKNLEENTTTYDRERLLNGNWNARPKSGAEFLKEFSQDKHVKKGLHKLYNPNLPLHISFDENLHPYITCEIIQIQTESHVEGDRRKVLQLWEICKEPPNNTRKKVCRAILDQFQGTHLGGVFVYGDATSQKGETSKEYGENFFTEIMAELKPMNPKLKVPSKNPPVASKGGFLNLILERGYQGISFLVDSDCKKSIDDYSYAVEDEDGGIQKKRITNSTTGVSYEKHGHHIDALSYFICRAFQADFAKYLNGGKSFNYDVGNDRDYKFEREPEY